MSRRYTQGQVLTVEDVFQADGNQSLGRIPQQLRVAFFLLCGADYLPKEVADGDRRRSPKGIGIHRAFKLCTHPQFANSSVDEVA